MKIKLIRIFFICIAGLTIISCKNQSDLAEEMLSSEYNLKFSKLAGSWDEAIPLGNGMLGALVWQKDGRLRISLDRADLWDLRPVKNFEQPEWRYTWVKEQWEKDTYSNVQEMFDIPYDRDPAPSKIPGAALEFDVSSMGEIELVELKLKEALCEIKWKNGAELRVFISAGNTVGWFRFSGTAASVKPELVTPPYNLKEDSGDENPVTGQDLRRLGYPEGSITRSDSSLIYDQNGWGGFRYQVSIRWGKGVNMTEGCWSISSEFPGWEDEPGAEQITSEASVSGFEEEYTKHAALWEKYWSASGINIPDSLLNRQWYLEMYKLGSATGNGAPPISLQAVWTADNGKLPPWKGDFHHDLNTQLSYWPAYSANHLEQERGFIDWLQANKPVFEKYTKQYFQAPGLNVPGVTTLTGEPMGGWIQYSLGPTVSAWLGHHFYLHWRYTMDREFLEREAYPWISQVAVFLEAISIKDSSGLRRFPLSSSPEIFDNSRRAWFPEMTNYDLGLIRWTFEKAAELAGELGKADEATRWSAMLSEWPDFNIDPGTGFTYARGFPYNQSHRHFSHLMAFHPLGLVDWSNSEKDQQIIKSTIATLDKTGPDFWCGYSYSWLGNIKARAFDGEGAAEALRIFASDFCLPNSFHVNGDQSGTGKSKLTYRPFTLEGNFAFASGVQEMLIQSHTGIIRVFPSIPGDWKEVSFSKLRTEGAFLISASIEKGNITKVNIIPEKGGELKLLNPFKNNNFKCSSPFKLVNNIIVIETSPGQNIKIKA